jgi:ADP-L-glycero-D-manno-heptose 6-epimerase
VAGVTFVGARKETDVDYDIRGRVLVTGGAGFIGSALVWELNRQGFDDIVIADVLDRSEKWRNLVPLRFHDYLEAADLLAMVERDDTVLDEYALILHLGACSSTTETDAAYLMRNNYGFTKTLAEAAIARGVRFVYASSAATYGGLEHDLSESRPLVSLRPLNMYALSKQRFDLYAERTGILDRIVGLKYFNIYGPNERHKDDMRSVVSKAFDQIRGGSVVRLFKSYRPDFADGQQQRDFLYVKDAVKMTLTVATNPGAVGIFNVGSGEARTWLDLARAVFAALGKPPAIEFVDMPDTLKAKYQYHTRARTERLAEAGFRDPLHSLEDGVADYVQRYLVDDRYLDPAVPEPGGSSAGAAGYREPAESRQAG